MPKEGSRGKPRTPTKKELQAKIRGLQAEVKRKDERIEKLTNRLAYLQAEVENLQKRFEKERSEVLRLATEALLRRLLPVMDEFELALNSMKERDDDFINGVRMIYENFIKVLQAEGLQEIEAEGEIFDPYLHEAVDYVQGNQEGRIVKVLLKGYRLEDRVLRPSQVVVCRKGGE